MAQTSSKRDREKLKEQKRKEKQQRKEERQSSGKSSFEDMIAYIDENGQLHSEPPEKRKTGMDLADIEISTPKQGSAALEPKKGVVDHFNASKGYGFVKDSSNNIKYFFHISSAPQTIKVGDYVTFEIERSTRGINAVQISIINKQ